MADVERVTTTFTLVLLVAGNPGSVVLSQTGRQTNGACRTQRVGVEVHDPRLFAALQASARPGDFVEATIETDWDAAGVPSVLVEYRVLTRQDGVAATV